MSLQSRFLRHLFCRCERCILCGKVPSTQRFQDLQRCCRNYSQEHCTSGSYLQDKIFPVFSVFPCPANHTVNSGEANTLFPTFPNSCTPFRCQASCVLISNNRKLTLQKMCCRKSPQPNIICNLRSRITNRFIFFLKHQIFRKGQSKDTESNISSGQVGGNFRGHHTGVRGCYIQVYIEIRYQRVYNLFPVFDFLNLVKKQICFSIKRKPVNTFTKGVST